jgi:hypothetical protein
MEQKTHKALEYIVGSGATIDLFILWINACMSCSDEDNTQINN